MAPGDLVEGPAGPGRTHRDPNLDEELVVVEGGREMPEEELVGRTGSVRAVTFLTTISAPVIVATAGSSAEASAWAMLPPIVPRLRIDTWPIRGSASAQKRQALRYDRGALGLALACGGTETTRSRSG